MKNNTSEVLNEIYTTLDRQKVVAELNPKLRSSGKGEYYEIDCPKCSEKGKAFIYSNGKQITCNRKDQCGHTTTLWDYVKDKKGLTNQETLQELSNLSSFTLPELNEEYVQKIGKSMDRAKLIESTMDFYKAQIWTNHGKEIRLYLNSRGYSDDEILSMELGFNPSFKETTAYLIGQGYKEYSINDVLKYLPYRDTHQLVFPYRDFSGRSSDLWGRLTSKSKEEAKYKPYTEASKSTPFYLDKARGMKELILVEGYFDAMIATERGVKGVIALGGSRLMKDHLESIVKNGTKRIFLSLDNDQAGFDGTEQAIKMIVHTDIEVFVVTLPKGSKDPDEMITKHGVDSFCELIKQAQSGAKWLGKCVSGKYDTNSDVGRRTAIKEVFSCLESIKNPLDRKDLLDSVSSSLDIPMDLLRPSLEEAGKVENIDKFKKGCEDLFNEGSKLLEECNFDALDKLLKKSKPDLKSTTPFLTIQPYTLSDLQKDLARTKEGLKTGYQDLDELVRIPNEAITLIGGRPSHGKTTFMLNLFLNQIRLYPNLHFYFFSYEETRQQIAVKIINILSGWIFDEAKNIIQLEGYLKSGSNSFQMVERGKQEYQTFVNSGRLRIIAEPYYVDDLSTQIAYLRAREPLGAVFIDYIQKVKNKQKFGTRQLELQNTSEIILETAKSCSIPIILGAQLGRDRESKDKVKLDNLREAGDLEQDANLVLGIFNPSMEKAHEEQTQLKSRTVNLNVTPLKNRNGIVNKTVILDFDRPLLKIKDSGKK